MNLELLYMIPMYFGNDIIPKLIHFAFALGTAWIIFVYIKNRLNILYGLFGSLLFLSTPIIVKLSITAYVDLGLVFFSTASLVLLLKWGGFDYKLRYLIYSAICCGLALGTKYNGLVVLFLLTLLTPIMYIREKDKHHEIKNRSLLRQSKAIGYGVIFFAVALMIFSPWMVRNYSWKKNPIYPLYHSIIRPKASLDIEQSKNRNITSRVKYNFLQNQKGRWNHFSVRRIIYKETWCEIALIPFRIFFQGKDGDPKYFDGKLNPLLLILPFGLLFFKRKEDPASLKTQTWFILIFSAAYLIYTFVSRDMRIRYIAPIIPPLVILAAIGFKRVQEVIQERCPDDYKRFLSYLATLPVILFMLMNASYLIGQFKLVKPFEYICGKADRDTYITKFRPEYPVFQYANRNLPEQTKVLGMFLGNRKYYMDRNILFDNQMLIKTIKSGKSSKGVLKVLKEKSITHLIIWDKYFIQYARENCDYREIFRLQVFFKEHTKAIDANGGYTLYQVL